MLLRGFVEFLSLRLNIAVFLIAGPGFLLRRDLFVRYLCFSLSIINPLHKHYP